MAVTKYTYSIANDTLNGTLSASSLKDEIGASSIVTALDYVSSLGDVLDIYMKDALSAGDQTTLNGVVSAHDGVFNPDDAPKDSSNAPIVRLRAFSNTDNLKFRGTGISGTATKTTTTDIDYKLPEDRYINGIDLLLKDHAWGDGIDFQVVDVDNILGYGAGTVLDQFGTSWFVDPNQCDQGQILVSYPALINKDLYIRIKYHSVGTVNDVELKCNLFLHKKP